MSLLIVFGIIWLVVASTFVFAVKTGIAEKAHLVKRSEAVGVKQRLGDK